MSIFTAIRKMSYSFRIATVTPIMLLIAGCASLSYYSGSSNDKDQIRQVLLIHAQSVVTGMEAGHKETQIDGAIHAGSFTGEHPGNTSIRAETAERVEAMSHTGHWVPPEREIVTSVRLTRMNIKFLQDTVAFATFREIGFDSMNREVYRHDVAAFLSKEGRAWLIYAMAGGDVVFDREGLDRYWEVPPEVEDGRRPGMINR